MLTNRTSALLAMAESMSPEEREIVNARYVSGETEEVTCSRLQISLAVYENRLARLLVNLRKSASSLREVRK